MNKDIAYDNDDSGYKKIKFHIPPISNAVTTSTSTTNTDNDYEYLQGELSVPYSPVVLKSLIIFAHGSSSSRKSIRNRYVSRILNNNGFATLLTDLLTTNEVNSDIKSQKIMDNNEGEQDEGTSSALNKFNIHLLSNRLTTITKWVTENISEVKNLPIGYFGRSTGAAAAIESAAAAVNDASNLNSVSNGIYAIVSRGGRPDLADSNAQKNVKAATLLIVGAKDSKEIIELNKQALQQLTGSKSKDLVIVPEASHLFDNNENVIEEVANITSEWFTKNIGL
jgi:putative phosphoribosyl transferase